jgi:hypothetical protein
VIGALARTITAPRLRLGVLNNLHAGRNRRQRDDMRALVGVHRDVVYVESEGAADVHWALETFARREVGLIAVGGGDGTLQHALTAILADARAAVPMIAPLCGGRTNMNALDLGCTDQPVRAVGRLAAAVDASDVRPLEVIERPVLRMDLGVDGVQYGMFGGFGVMHRAVQLVHQTFPPGRSQGTFAAAVVTASLVARAALRSTSGLVAPDPMEVCLDGETLPHASFRLAIVTTLGRLFLGLRPFWGREHRPVRVTAIAHPAVRVAAAAPGILRGRPRPHVRPENGYNSRNVRRADFVIDSGVLIDGELFAARPGRRVRVEADHRVRFVRA